MRMMKMMLSAMLLLHLSFNVNYVSCGIRSSNRFIRLSLLLLKTNNFDSNNNNNDKNNNNTIDNSNDNDCVDGVCTIKPRETVISSLQDQVISDWRDALVTSENIDVDVHNDSNSSSSVSLQKNDTVIGIDTIADSGVSNLTLSSVSSSESSAVSLSELSSGASVTPPPIQVDKSKVEELIKLGWSTRDAERALIASDNDIISAAGLLESEEEEAEVLRGI